MALPVESDGLFEAEDVPVLFCGVGKVNAAIALSRELCLYTQAGRRPPLVVEFRAPPVAGSTRRVPSWRVMNSYSATWMCAASGSASASRHLTRHLVRCHGLLRGLNHCRRAYVAKVTRLPWRIAASAAPFWTCGGIRLGEGLPDTGRRVRVRQICYRRCKPGGGGMIGEVMCIGRRDDFSRCSRRSIVLKRSDKANITDIGLKLWYLDSGHIAAKFLLSYSD